MESSERPDPREASPSLPAPAAAFGAPGLGVGAGAGEESGEVQGGARLAPGVGSARPTLTELGGDKPVRWPREFGILTFFFLAAALFTCPLVLRLDAASGLRGDYFNNLWNAWWVGDSITGGHSPYWTDHLYFPDGISLRRHTLSPLNSLFLWSVGALTGAQRAFSLLVLVHVALSGWCFSLFARYLTGHTPGSVLGGLLYTFAPFHFYYLCQVNVFSFEFLPLGLLFFVRAVRTGGARNLVGLCLALAGMAMSAEYYVVYAYMTFGLLLLMGRTWAPEVPAALRWRRATIGGACGAVVVVLVAFQLLYATLGPERGAETGTAAFAAESFRANDLLGFYWVGPQERCNVSWPTMLGYSTFLLLALGWKGLLRLTPWLVIGLVFFVLSLGNELLIGGRATGIPMPYAVLEHVPVLSMLRKSDRAFMMVQLIAALALAGAWSHLSRRMRAGAPRRIGFGLAALVPLLEVAPLGLGRFELETSPYLRQLAGDPDVKAVLELPAARSHVANARFVYFQTLHEKKSTLGYTTALAVTPLHDQRVQDLINWYWQFVFDRGRTLVRQARAFGVDLILHYKTIPLSRPRDERVDLVNLWQPFFRVRAPLLFVRQVGEFTDKTLDQSFTAVVTAAVPELVGQIRRELADQNFLEVVRLQLQRACGPPIYEDQWVMVFEVPQLP